MARKGRESLTEAPPPADSSSEEIDSDSDEYESSSEDGDDQTQQPQQTPKKPDQPSKPRVSESDSDTESNTESGTDSDADPKSIPSDNPKPKPASSPAPSVSNKRKNTDAESSDKVLTPKKVKKEKSEPSGSTTSGTEESGKKLFQRVWSEDDEIVILKGLIEFQAKKGKTPMSDVDGYVDFIKNSLHVPDVKKEQIVSKVRRLKSRYENAKKRNLSNPHELYAFQLSKAIWGGFDDDENNNEMSAKSPNSKAKSKASNVKSKGVKNAAAVNGGVLIDGGKKAEDADEKAKGDELIKADEGNAASGGLVMTVGASLGIQLSDLNKYGDMDDKFMHEGLKRLDVDEREELEEEWRNFNVLQMESLVKRLELYHKTAKRLLNALKSPKL